MKQDRCPGALEPKSGVNRKERRDHKELRTAILVLVLVIDCDFDYEDEEEDDDDLVAALLDCAALCSLWSGTAFTRLNDSGGRTRNVLSADCLFARQQNAGRTLNFAGAVSS